MKEVCFTTDKRGRLNAYRVCRLQMRLLRISPEAARLLISTGKAKEIAFRPFGKAVN